MALRLFRNNSQLFFTDNTFDNAAANPVDLSDPIFKSRYFYGIRCSIMPILGNNSNLIGAWGDVKSQFVITGMNGNLDGSSNIIIANPHLGVQKVTFPQNPPIINPTVTSIIDARAQVPNAPGAFNSVTFNCFCTFIIGDSPNEMEDPISFSVLNSF